MSSIELPISYKCESYSDGLLVWMCALDENKKITSVFTHVNSKGETERHIQYLENMAKVEDYICELVRGGWIQLKRPTINLTFSDKQQ